MYEKTRLAAKVLKQHKRSGNKKKGAAQTQKLKDAMMHEVNMLSRLEYGARFSTKIYTLGCYWFSRLLA
jgi:hypothetical protein